MQCVSLLEYRPNPDIDQIRSANIPGNGEDNRRRHENGQRSLCCRNGVNGVAGHNAEPAANANAGTAATSARPEQAQMQTMSTLIHA